MSSSKRTSQAVVPVSSEETIDFIGPSHAVKDLFSLPYCHDKGVSVAVHNMNGTLLIDADTTVVDAQPPTRRRKRPRPKEHRLEARSHDDAALATVTSMLHLKDDDDEHSEDNTEQGQGSVEGQHRRLSNVKSSKDGVLSSFPPAEYYSEVPPVETPREYLSWKFRGLNLIVGSDALVFRHPEQDALAIRVAERSELRALIQKHRDMVQKGQFVPDHSFTSSKSYAEALASKSKQLEEQPKSYAAPDLKQVQLQTCIVPSSTTPLGSTFSQAPVDSTPSSSSPIYTVLDAYLDNIMANVPQLALCLREKGFIQSVKLMRTDEIPSSLMHTSTLDASASAPTSGEPPLFSPHIMEMNASTLLGFLQANCTRDNATYLLRREAGETNIQLYDVTAISASRQRKWIWWLAMMSYRFALRLGHLGETDRLRRRNFRGRQRSLLQTSLELLHELNDMDGGAHETLCASVEEHLADTFLWSDEESSFSVRQPYSHVTVDALTKAQDHLTNGIRVLWPLLERTEQHAKESRNRRNAKKKAVVVVHSGESSSSSSSDDDDDSSSGESVSLELQSISMQLFGLHHKSINVSLRLAEHHLQNYFSSSAMRELRSAARRIADATGLLRGSEDVPDLQHSLQCQYTWLWEHCGHFARSFAADELWRERGHACGDDVISVLRDAESALKSIAQADSSALSSWIELVSSDAPLTEKSNGSVSLRAVSGLVDLSSSSKEPKSPSSALQKARKLLDKHRQIQRDKLRVLVAASVSYSRAIGAFLDTSGSDSDSSDGPHTSPEMNARKTVNQAVGRSHVLSMLQQRLGDGCNEIGKILLDEVRSLLSNPNLTEGLTSDDDIPAVGDALLSSADFWFTEGLEMFQGCDDVCNVALLRCNLCQCCKLRANSNFASASAESGSSSHAETCLQRAADHLQMAHASLGERDTNPRTWDMASDELAATFLVLGVRRRQTLLGGGTAPVIMQEMRLSPGKERSIVEPMERALEIYTKLGNGHQAAAVNYQLALFYSKIWTCQRDEAKTRDKLSKAFQHFGSAHAYFSRAPEGNEPTFVILSLDMANLYAVVSGKECLSKALSRCLDTASAFSFEAIDAALERQEQGDSEWFDKMSTLASSLEDRVFKLLVSLVKIEKDSGEKGSAFREMYRAGLTAKMAMKARNEQPGTPDFLSSFHELLTSIKDHQE